MTRARFVSTLPALLIAVVSIALALVGLAKYGREQAAVSGQGTVPEVQLIPANTPQYSYLFAREDIAAGAELIPELFVTVATSEVLPGALKGDEVVFGQVLEQSLTAGAPLTQKVLSATSPLGQVLKDGHRAVAVDLTPLSSVGGLLRPGDLVDIIATFKKTTQIRASSLVLFKKIQVLAVQGITDTNSTSAEDGNNRNATMVLAVPEAEVSRLSLAFAEAQIRFVATTASDKPNVQEENGNAFAEQDVAQSLLPLEQQAVFLTDIRPESPDRVSVPTRQSSTGSKASSSQATDSGLRVRVFEGSNEKVVYVR